MFYLRWLISKTLREAVELARHARKHRNAQCDILPADRLERIDGAIEELRAAIDAGAAPKELTSKMEALERIANDNLKPYPHAWIRENLEVFLVVVALVLAFRTFFLQPFKIPTGSMQPTLYGITSENLKDTTDVPIPGGFQRIADWFAGVSYVHIVADADNSVVEAIEPPLSLRIFNLKQRIRINGRWKTIWFPPDYGNEPLESRARLMRGTVYKAGEDIIKLKVIGGDHLFVDRMTYNFRPPTRGEIVVFETKGISALPQDEFYIKRLVALGGENVSIGDDSHLVINGQRLDAGTPRFEMVYGFGGTHQGHANGTKGIDMRPHYLFADAQSQYQVRTNHLMVMGDNTFNSYDSRGWGDFKRENVIGKAFCVYWPLSKRFGWGFR